MGSYENLINTVLDGRYRLTAVIGTGGMAVIYEADDLSMGRRVAVKMLKDDTKEDDVELKRFVNESKAIAMMAHPNIVQIFDVSVNGGKHKYIVMELIDGITLKEYISKKGRLKWQEAIRYIEQILHALGHSHAKGIIHRDVKPQNVMLLRSGSLKVTDFGIAKIPNSEQLTMTDKAIGTVHYISPEQVNGTGNITTVSDIYSAGIILYEMMTATLPFEGENAFQIARKQIEEAPVDPRAINPEMPKGLSQIILKAMSKSTQNRYQTTGEMIRHLDIIKANPAAVLNGNISNTGASVALRDEPAQRRDAVNVGNNHNQIISRKGSRNQRGREEFDEDEMRERGRTPKKAIKRRSSRSMLPIICGVTLAFLIVVGVSIFNIAYIIIEGAGVGADNSAEIPDFINRPISQVEAEIREDPQYARFAVGEISFVNNDIFEENRIITHSPAPGDERRLLGTHIRIDFTVSKGRYAYIVEDLALLEGRSIQLELESRRQLRVERVHRPDDFVPAGYIIYTNPGPGTVLRAGDTIWLYVSSGQEIRRVLMPNVVGRGEREARRMLLDADIVIREIISAHSDTVAAGYIIEQSILPLTRVPARSTRVTLTVSIGPEPPEAAGGE